ncbi:MAG: hypothetical protein KKH61_20660 [Gammaproteobacteria bacterium]|nr:hypothetical protein [Gammaproteobacteria bacterium]
MTISRHAAIRYIERIRPCALDEAFRQLEGIAPAAVEEKVIEDGECWLRAGCLRLVTYEDHVVTCYVVGERNGGA